MTESTIPTKNTLLLLDEIKDHIIHDLVSDPTLELSGEQELLLSGILDSINVIKLVEFISEKSSLTISPADIVVENFGSLNQMDLYLLSRTQES